MGKTKTKTTGTTSGATSGTMSGSTVNTYGWQTPPEWQGLSDLRGFQFQSDPSISPVFATARNSIQNSFQNPLGGVYSPQMRDQILRSSLSDLAQKESIAKSQDSYRNNQLEYQKRLAVAGMGAPHLTQTGGTTSGATSGTSSGTMSGTTTQSGNFWDYLLRMGQNAGQAAAMFADGGDTQQFVGDDILVGEEGAEIGVDGRGQARLLGLQGPEVRREEKREFILPASLTRNLLSDLTRRMNLEGLRNG